MEENWLFKVEEMVSAVEGRGAGRQFSIRAPFSAASYSLATQQKQLSPEPGSPTVNKVRLLRCS